MVWQIDCCCLMSQYVLSLTCVQHHRVVCIQTITTSLFTCIHTYIERKQCSNDVCAEWDESRASGGGRRSFLPGDGRWKLTGKRKREARRDGK